MMKRKRDRGFPFLRLLEVLEKPKEPPSTVAVTKGGRNASLHSRTPYVILSVSLRNIK